MATDIQSTSPTSMEAAHRKAVQEARRKFIHVLDEEVLDYKHNHPVYIENCVNTLIRIFGNVLDSPSDQKYREIKTGSHVFKTHIAAVRGGEHLMTLAGWKTRVIDLQKSWYFDGELAMTKMEILGECKTALEKALRTVHEKAERKRHESEEKRAHEAREREAIRLALEDDRKSRQLRAETLQTTGIVHAQPLPSDRRHEGAHLALEE